VSSAIRAIRNGLVVTPEGVIRGGVLVEGERIAAVASDSSLPTSGDGVIDAHGCFVLPGLVDPEAHLGSNVGLDEDFASESAAAVAAGVTTWNLHQTTHTIFRAASGRPDPSEQLVFSGLCDEFDNIGESNSHCDFVLTPLLMTLAQADEIALLADRGVTSFKLYMHMQLGREQLADAWPQAPLLGVQSFDDSLVYKAMREVAALGPVGLLSMHCENWEIARFRESELKASGRTDLEAWHERSPGFLESMHVRTYAYLAGQLGCRLHIQHVTVPETLRELKLARSEGVKIYGQTAAHYLVLDSSAWKLNVPLRPADVHETMWEALATDVVNSVGTDHVCRRLDREAMDKGNVWATVSGFPSRVEAHLPLLLTEGVAKGRLSIERLCEVTATNPSKIWGLYPRKGAIRVGSDADFVLVDPTKRITLGPQHIQSAAGWSLYEGREFTGWPVMTVLRGKVVAEWDGDSCSIPDEPGGRSIHRGQAAIEVGPDLAANPTVV
jgi:dihydropyrimidinase